MHELVNPYITCLFSVKTNVFELRQFLFQDHLYYVLKDLGMGCQHCPWSIALCTVISWYSRSQWCFLIYKHVYYVIMWDVMKWQGVSLEMYHILLLTICWVWCWFSGEARLMVLSISAIDLVWVRLPFCRTVVRFSNIVMHKSFKVLFKVFVQNDFS